MFIVVHSDLGDVKVMLGWIFMFKYGLLLAIRSLLVCTRWAGSTPHFLICFTVSLPYPHAMILEDQYIERWMGRPRYISKFNLTQKNSYPDLIGIPRRRCEDVVSLCMLMKLRCQSSWLSNNQNFKSLSSRMSSRHITICTNVIKSSPSSSSSHLNIFPRKQFFMFLSIKLS